MEETELEIAHERIAQLEAEKLQDAEEKAKWRAAAEAARVYKLLDPEIERGIKNLQQVSGKGSGGSMFTREQCIEIITAQRDEDFKNGVVTDAAAWKWKEIAV